MEQVLQENKELIAIALVAVTTCVLLWLRRTRSAPRFLDPTARLPVKLIRKDVISVSGVYVCARRGSVWGASSSQSVCVCVCV